MMKEDSQNNHLLLNWVNLLVLLGCLTAKYWVHWTPLALIYENVSDLFAFDIIEMHASRASDSAGLRAHLLFLWAIFPAYVLWLAIKSSRKLLLKNAGDKSRRVGLWLTLVMMLVAPLLGFLFVTPEPSFCRGCEYESLVIGGVIRVGSIWLIGLTLGQMIAFARFTKQGDTK